MSTTYDGVDLDSTQLQVSGSIVLTDEQAEIVRLGETVEITIRGRVKGKSAQTGGQNTKPRLVATVALDALDSLATTDALPGQLQIGDDAEPPSDDD